MEVDPKNPKKLHLSFKNQRILKGDTLTYILDDYYPETEKTYRGPWLIDAFTGVGAVGFSEVIK